MGRAWKAAAQEQRRRWEPVKAATTGAEEVAAAPTKAEEAPVVEAVSREAAEPGHLEEAVPLLAIAPPPGLEGMCSLGALPFAPPPGLAIMATSGGEASDEDAEEQASEAPKPVCRVCIKGIPNKLLSETMMEAVIEQADLTEEVTSFVSKRSSQKGKTCGQVTLELTTFAAAERCTSHFQGCQWDCSGTNVDVELLPLEGEEALDMALMRLKQGEEAIKTRLEQEAKEWVACDSFLAKFAAWKTDYGQNTNASDDYPQVPKEAAVLAPRPLGINRDAPVFVPTMLGQEESTMLPSLGGFSKEAPVFIPATGFSCLGSKDHRKISDVSTEAGDCSGSSLESDAEEEEQRAHVDDALLSGFGMTMPLVSC